jgi:hypothetical protein
MGSAFGQSRYVMPKAPTGRLTLVSGTPVMSTEQANKTNIYYTPYVGATVPLYDGTGWYEMSFTELTLALAASANWAANSNYDLFLFNDSGTLRLLTGPVWTNDTTRATDIGLVSGIYTNSASMTGRYGASSTVTVGQYLGTYVGTMRTTGSAGTTTWELGGTAANGDIVRYFLWNCYNGVEPNGWCRDSTSNWTYSSTTYRPFNNSQTNRVEFVLGDASATIFGAFSCMCYVPADSRYGAVALALDSITAFVAPSTRANFYAGGLNELQSPVFCNYNGTPGLGFHYLQGMESGHGSGFGFYGGSDHIQWIRGRF